MVTASFVADVVELVEAGSMDGLAEVGSQLLNSRENRIVFEL